MAAFCVPEHTELSHCQHYSITTIKCGYKAKYRLVSDCNKVRYTCGHMSHMEMFTCVDFNKNPFFIQEKKKNKWIASTVRRFSNQMIQHNGNNYEEPKGEPNEAPAIHALRYINIQMESKIKCLEKQIQEQQKIIGLQNNVILSLQNTKQKDDGDFPNMHTQLQTDTALALVNARSDNTVKNLKFQLHPDKHPKELSWLFTILFQIVNV